VVELGTAVKIFEGCFPATFSSDSKLTQLTRNRNKHNWQWKAMRYTH